MQTKSYAVQFMTNTRMNIDQSITRNTHTSNSTVGDLSLTSKKLIFKLIEHVHHNINGLLHNEVVNRFVKIT